MTMLQMNYGNYAALLPKFYNKDKQMQDTPEMTPEMYAELAGEQAQSQVAPQAMAQPAPQQEQQPQTPDEVAQAKELLGLGQTENTISELQAQMQIMQEDKLRDSLSAKYPDVPYDIVKKEIAKLDGVNPEFAHAMRTTPEAMEMAYKAAQVSIQPQEKPDNLTDGAGGGGQGENLDEVVRTGKANDYDLGQFIIGGK